MSDDPVTDLSLPGLDRVTKMTATSTTTSESVLSPMSTTTVRTEEERQALKRKKKMKLGREKRSKLEKNNSE